MGEDKKGANKHTKQGGEQRDDTGEKKAKRPTSESNAGLGKNAVGRQPACQRGDKRKRTSVGGLGVYTGAMRPYRSNCYYLRHKQTTNSLLHQQQRDNNTHAKTNPPSVFVVRDN